MPLLTIAALAILASLHFARGLLIPLALAVFFATILAPMVNRLQAWRLPRALAVPLVMLLVLGALGAVVDATIDPAREWLDRAPQALREVERKIRPLRRMVVKIDEVAAHAERVAEGSPAGGTAAAAPARKSMLLSQTPAAMITVAGTFFLTFFLLVGGPALLSRLAGGADHPHAEAAVRMIEAAQRETAQYLGTVALINLGLGLATAGLAAAFSLPTPLLWGVLAATLNFVPYAGSAVTLGVLTFVALLTRDGLGPAAGVAVSYLALATIEGQLVQPLAVGRRLSLSPLLVLLALWFWGWMWGVAGLILATPMLLAAKAISCQAAGLGRIAQILGPVAETSPVQVAAQRWCRKPSA